MLINRHESCLLIIDVQEKLTPLIHEQTNMLAGCTWLTGLARRLKVPVLVSEQYPKGLGCTIPAIKNLLPDTLPLIKTEFSCVANPHCLEQIHQLNRPQIVIAGIETHVCVLQTALELVQQGKTVFVVADATSSRSETDKQLGIERMRSIGVQIVSREMVLFEWLRRSDVPEFKLISKEFFPS
jgi:nicotinamidase-related amidase